MLFAEVQKIFESARSISRAARDIRELRNGRLTICTLPAFGLTLMPSIIASFSKLHPSVPIALDIRSSATVIQRAARNQLDIGVGTTSTDELPSVVRRALVTTSPICVMPIDHPMANLDVVQVEDLEGVDFISMGAGDPMRKQLDAVCETRGINRSMTVEVALSSACINLVANRAGVAVVDRLSAWWAKDLPIAIRDFQPHLDLSLSVYRPWGKIASSIADAFTEHLIQTTRSHMTIIEAEIRGRCSHA